ncbi:MAG: LCP family protein [Dehalococcoidia bacterium]|nr:LCP family protein [Dehalococcoidia bacterium]
MAGGGYALRQPGSMVRRAPALASGGQRALYAFAVLTLFLAASYTGVAMLARVTPALFPGRSLNNVGVVALLDRVVSVPSASATGSFTDPIHVLVLGIDKRPQYEFREDQTGVYLTDVVMVASIDPVTKKTTLLSFPRDMLIKITRKDGSSFQGRINRSYGIGVDDGGSRSTGIEQVKRDLMNDFAIEIDYSILIDFKGVEGLVDSLGGVTVDVPEVLSIYDWYYSDDDLHARYISFPTGVNHLDGYHAVAFGRNREGDSDLYRIKRQQLVVKAAVDKTFSSGIIGRDPFELWDAYNSFVKTDIPRGSMLGLADIGKRTNGSMLTYSLGDPVDGVPTMIPFTMEDGAAVLKWNPENVQYWLARAFPVTRHADAVVELRNGFGNAEQGNSRTAALGRYLVYSKGLVTVYYGDDAAASAKTRVILHREAQRSAADDIAEWLGLQKDGVVVQPVSADDTSSPDISVVVGADFVIPGSR